MLVLRSNSHANFALSFFVFYALLFALANLGDTTPLRSFGIRAIWVGFLISILLTLTNIIHNEYANGSLDYFLLSDLPLEIIIFCKTLVHWITVTIPLLIISPVLMIALQINQIDLFRFFLVLFLGSPALSFVGMMISCLTMSNSSSLLVALLTIPFYFPSLLLGIYCSSYGENTILSFSYLLLICNTLFSIVVSPFVSAYAIKLHYS